MTNKVNLEPASQKPPDPCNAVLEAYKRHSAELKSIDDQLATLISVILGIFGAGATLFSKYPPLREGGIDFGLAVVTITLVGFWIWYVKERHEYRQSVRGLLVRCELAMGFYAPSWYLKSDSLYSCKEKRELDFPKHGDYLFYLPMVTVCGAAIGLLFVIFPCQICAAVGCSMIVVAFAIFTSAMRKDVPSMSAD